MRPNRWPSVFAANAKPSRRPSGGISPSSVQVNIVPRKMVSQSRLPIRVEASASCSTRLSNASRSAPCVGRSSNGAGRRAERLGRFPRPGSLSGYAASSPSTSRSFGHGPESRPPIAVGPCGARIRLVLGRNDALAVSAFEADRAEEARDCRGPGLHVELGVNVLEVLSDRARGEPE